MKKLMLIAAVAFCGAAFAEGEITSNNIVGYMNNGNTVAGLNLLAPGFNDIGYTSIKLNSLKVTNATGGDVTTGKFSIQLIDAKGGSLAGYTWLKIGRGDAAHWGWSDGKGEASDSVVFGRGVGLLVRAENNGDKLDSAGEVDLSGLAFGDTVAGLNVVANPYPVSVKVNKLRVLNAIGGDANPGKCSIQLIDSNGRSVDGYSWSKIGRGDAAHWGWLDGAAEITDSVVLGAGDAVLFTAENGGDQLIFPDKK